MTEVISIFDSIKNTSSLNEKKEIIAANKDNELFKKCLVFLLDSNITTGISDKKWDKIDVCSTNWEHGYIVSEFEDLMKYIQQNNSGRDDDVIMCKAWCCGLPKEVQDFTRQMVTKKYRLGCDAKVVNNVIPGLIPTFDVMLGTSVEKCKIPEGTWFSLSQKLNGNRCIFVNGELWTRQGKKYTGLDHIINDIETSFAKYFDEPITDYVLDGELIYKNEDENLSDSEAFQYGTGIAQSKDKDKSCLRMVVFDVIKRADFEIGISLEKYSERKPILQALRDYETNNLKIVDMYYEGTDQKEIWKLLDWCEENDVEGLMVNLDAPYECKRTKNLIKVKKFYEFDLQITGTEEGTGRNKGKLGSFIVDFKGNPVNVGSGYSDSEREDFWQNREDYIGRVITVKYKEITKSKDTGLESLQFPVFCGLREVGKEVSYD